MNKKPLFLLVLSAALLAASIHAMGAPASSCAPQWREGWIRLPPMASMPMLAGFGRIANDCEKAVAVVAASSPGFADVSLHESINQDGVNRMREVEALRVEPGKAAVLQPGGLHLMLMQPKAGLKEGDKVPLSLKLEDGREIHGELVVRKTAP